MTSFADARTHPPESLDQATALLQALAHPVRLRILHGLLSGDCCVGSIVDCLDLPQPLVSRHLAILRAAGVLEAIPQGRQRTYRVVHPAVAGVLCSVFPTEPPADPPPPGA